MRKHILLPGVALCGGILGFGLRFLQVASAYNPETQLFLPSPISVGLAAVLAVSLGLLLFLSHSVKGPEDFLPAFRCPAPMFMAVMAGAGFLMLGAGFFGLMNGMEVLALWRSYPGSIQLSVPLVMLLCALFCLPAGVSLLLVGKGCYRGSMPPAAMLLSPLPGFAGLTWVLSFHLQNGTDPVFLRYGITLLAAVFLTLAHYYAVSFLFARCHPQRMVFCTGAGVVLGLTALADRLALPDFLLILSLGASALALSFTLLHNGMGLVWRMPQEAENGKDGDSTQGEIE